MFTVMGITGKVGGAIAENLLAAGKRVRGVVRNPEKARAWADRGVEVVESVYDDARGLAEAFAGSEGVFAMVPPDFAPAPGLPDQRRTIAAFREALESTKPGKAVFLSSIGSEQPSGLGLITSTHLMEEATRTLPIPVAYLRAGSFMENWLGALDHIRTTGEMPFFYAPLERRFPLVATQDIGLAGAKVLQESWKGERVIEVDGPKGGTDLYEVAAAFGKALGREVKAVQLPEQAWQGVLEAMGMPADRTGLYIEMVKNFNSGWIHFGNPGTETFHGPTNIETFAQGLKEESPA
ncbi:NmrA family NAD(P)-binding protein [Edaphobacter sp. 12200R-103]|uniref:NmrA family NAD(P)-binding protein n=1 Tax=Edaphobacter sp. 12200R-103 TaxID=2703788 RepID=UPI00138C6905|nr:NmrA family NAD(P)-binding protein [Edaphobacter sp. 12200R-103]QHS52617.1 NmrA family NAD(P)-binding protein [Edaphobacter sp. 12200R-103]